MSDHFSGPAVMGDPAVDITDFYAFPSPERPGHLVLDHEHVSDGDRQRSSAISSRIASGCGR